MAAWDELHNLIRRVEELARRIEQEERLATGDVRRDELYGCYPRAYLADRLPAELARAERFGRSLALGLLAFEEAVFTSDSVRGLREALSTGLDRFDVPVCYGPRRLLLLLPELSARDARMKVERFAQSLAARGVAPSPPRRGVVAYPELRLSPAELLEALERVVERERRKVPFRGMAEGFAASDPPEAGPQPASPPSRALEGTRNGLATRALSDEPVSSETPVAVGFASNRRFPVSFWRGETLHVIHAILADETVPPGSRRISVLTDGGGFLLYEKAGRWFAEALPPSNGKAPRSPDEPSSGR